MTRKLAGFDGEAVAAQYLDANRYVVIDRNFVSRNGEIDIVAKKSDVLVFIEVKTYKKKSLVAAALMITQAKKERIYKTSRWFLVKRPEFSDFQIRFDYIAVEEGEVVKHLENVIEFFNGRIG